MKTSLSEWAGRAAMVAALAVAAIGSYDSFAQVLPTDSVKRGEHVPIGVTTNRGQVLQSNISRCVAGSWFISSL